MDLFYFGFVSPLRSPMLKKHKVWDRRLVKKNMGEGSSTVPCGMKESSVMWVMLTRSNYSEWAMLMQCNYEAMEIWETIDPGGAGVKRT